MRKNARFISFAAFCAILALIGITLGTWQITRLQEKNALLHNIAERLKQPPLKLALSAAENLPPFTPIDISGHVSGAPQEVFLLLNRVDEGAVGRGLMQILHTPQGAVLADRGWVPIDYKATAEASVKISGILRPITAPGGFTPPNDPQKSLWYYINSAEMAQISGIALPNFYISGDKDFWRHIPNNHLQYALTWFALAAIFLFLPLSVRRFFADKPR